MRIPTSFPILLGLVGFCLAIFTKASNSCVLRFTGSALVF